MQNVSKIHAYKYEPPLLYSYPTDTIQYSLLDKWSMFLSKNVLH